MAANFKVLMDGTYIDVMELFAPHPSRVIASSLWTCGYNTRGQLGDGTIAHKSSPVQVGSLATWSVISVGLDHMAGIRTDGTLWTWGYNNQGQLGIGSTISKSSPVQVGSLGNWADVSCGYGSTMAIKLDGTLWSWGDNYYGQLGLGNTTDRSSPTQVGSLTNWKQASSGYRHAMAVKTDGTLWACGYDGYDGVTGLGSSGNKRSSPTQVGSLQDWKYVSAGHSNTAAIKTDGTLWVWGDNNYGQLGNGIADSYDSKSSPIQLGTLNTWKSVDHGYRSMVAIMLDGTLWSWGQNTAGELGDGTTTNKSSPSQVGALANWKEITAQYKTVAAIKTDGTIWSWGDNTNGQLGLGDITKRSSPVQIGSLTTWKIISVGKNGTAII